MNDAQKNSQLERSSPSWNGNAALHQNSFYNVTRKYGFHLLPETPDTAQNFHFFLENVGVSETHTRK